MSNLIFGSNNPAPTINEDESFKKKYGLNKIEDKISKSPTEYSILSQGIDLTTFGLNLNSSEDIIDSFGSPFDTTGFIPFQCIIPKCYMKKNNPTEAAKILPKLTDNTLIYTFYNVADTYMKLEAIKIL
jgi:NOT2 / NOT3 / NOT5 family